jgi:prevent-host-death family protein
VNIYDAKTQLSRLLAQVVQGEEIIMARAGKPLAKLVPYRDDDRLRVPGSWRGRVRVAPDFDALPPDLAAAFEGEHP